MNRIARFEKISQEQFRKDIMSVRTDIDSTNADMLYADIKLPVRATSGSAGYDFFLPFDICLGPNETFIIPTGIRSEINDGWLLMCCPRSGLGFKFRMRLDNTVGIIDSDYYYAANEGHIQIKITNETNENKTISLSKGSAFAQGIFLPYGITADDSADGIRTGGFGSTSG